MAPARPYWKGYLKLSLVSCPIALYPAISTAEKVSFRQVSRRTGHRLRHQLVDSVTGEVVESHDKGRGYEVGNNRFVMVEEEELQAARAAQPIAPTAAADLSVARASSAPPSKAAARHVVEEEEGDEPEELSRPLPVSQRPENTRTIEIEHFVPRVQLDPAFFEKPYFVTPRGQVGQEAYAVIRDAMRGKEVMGIGYVTLSSRKRPIALEPLENGIRGITLRHIEDMRSPAEYFIDIPELQLPPEMLELAEHIVGTKARDFNPAFLTLDQFCCMSLAGLCGNPIFPILRGPPSLALQFHCVHGVSQIGCAGRRRTTAFDPQQTFGMSAFGYAATC